MPISLLFWVIYIVAIVFGAWSSYTPGNWKPFSAYFVLWLLVGILGWAQFGPAVR